MTNNFNVYKEISNCFLCNNALCSVACPNKNEPARAIRAIKFDNLNCAGNYFSESCLNCDAECEKACINHNYPVHIKEIAKNIYRNTKNQSKVDLSIEFCNVHCENPFFLGSSVIANNYEMIARAFDMGWGGAYFKTICYYRCDEVSPRFDAVLNEDKPFVGFRNMEQLSEHSPQEDFEIIRRLKNNYPNKIIIASIMGQKEEEWKKLAQLSQEAGADMVECNFSCPNMTSKGMGSDIGESEELVTMYTKAAKSGTKLPVIAKMTPNVSHMELIAEAALKGGADAISAINTIKSITMNKDVCINGQYSVSGYSGKAVKPIALRFIYNIASYGPTSKVPISGIGGIETWRDALDFILMGCENLQIVTAVMQYGYRIIDDLILGLSSYMIENNISKIDDLKGKALSGIVPASNLDRSTVAFPKIDAEKCVGCGRCYISCRDGGHSAISFDENRIPKVAGSKCVGCHLCRLICPSNAITVTKRIKKIVK